MLTHISTLFGSKVIAHYVAVAATLEFVERQIGLHKDKFRKLLVCCLGGAQDTISNFHLSPNFPIKIIILLEWTTGPRPTC